MDNSGTTDMKQLKLVRASEYKDATFGVLCIDGRPMFVTLENAWKNNQRQISCIPNGEYKIKLHSSRRYGRVYQVCDVPDRSHILIHAGNTHKDTQGCILVGLLYGLLVSEPAVLSSRQALSNLMSAMSGHEEAQLEIINGHTR